MQLFRRQVGIAVDATVSKRSVKVTEDDAFKIYATGFSPIKGRGLAFGLPARTMVKSIASPALKVQLSAEPFGF
jgi:hypothetical protein